MAKMVTTPARTDTCGTCRYHVDGLCHGAPPSVFRYFGVRGLVVQALWPPTTDDDWCKEHEPQTRES